MPLEVGDLRAGDEDVLSGTGRRLLLLDLELHHHRRVLDDLVNIRPVTRADFPKDTLEDPNDTADEPVTLRAFRIVSSHVHIAQERVQTHPEDTNRVVRAVRRPVRLDHAEHTVELPVDEEHDEEVVRVPEPLEVCTAALLNGEPDHDTEGGGHDPAGRAGASDEVGGDEREQLLACRLRVGVDERELSEVNHVRDDVNDGENDDGPGDGLVERDVLVEGDERVQGRAAKKRDEVAADGEEDKRDIDVEDERSRTRDSCVDSRMQGGASVRTGTGWNFGSSRTYGR